MPSFFFSQNILKSSAKNYTMLKIFIRNFDAMVTDKIECKPLFFSLTINRCYFRERLEHFEFRIDNVKLRKQII